MDNQQASRAINRYWIEEWPTRSAAVMTAFSIPAIAGVTGIRFATDTNKAKEMKASPDEFFARIAIISYESEKRSLGPIPKKGQRGRRRFDHAGTIEVRISGPTIMGRDPFDAFAKVVRQMFQGRRIGEIQGREIGVSTQESEVDELRRDREAAGRWVITVSTDFEYTEIG